VTYMHSTTTPTTTPQAIDRCAVCNAALAIKQNGRRRHFCSDRCRDTARRNANFRDLGITRPNGSAMPRNPQKTSSNTTTCKAEIGDRGCAIKDRIVTVGLGIGTAQPATISVQVRRAVQLELSARWRRLGVRS
jgi:hypothetical protein